MTFESLVSKLYDTYTSQPHKSFYAKIFVANIEIPFQNERLMKGFLEMKEMIHIHYIRIDDPIHRQNYYINKTNYSTHHIKDDEIFVRAHNRHYHIPTTHEQSEDLKKVS